MTNSLALFLDRELTDSVKEEARNLLLKSKPDDVRELRFSCGNIDLSVAEHPISIYHIRHYHIKTYIPHDIQLVDVTQSFDQFYTGWNILFNPDTVTAINLYLYFIRPYLRTKVYFKWVKAILESISPIGNDCYDLMSKVLVTGIYRSETNTTDISKHQDQLHYQEWRDYLDWLSEQK